MGIITSIQESAEGWRMAFSSLLGGVSAKFSGVMAPMQKTENGTGFSATQQRYVGIKAGEVSVVSAEAQAPVGVRYIPATLGPSPLSPLPVGEGLGERVRSTGDETPASLVERIQKSIANSAEGWRMGFASVIGKAQTLSGKISDKMLETQTGVEKSVAGVGEWFGNLGEGMSSFKWLIYIAVAVLIFVGVMVSIGYSGVGAPVARIAEKEHARRR